MGFSEPDVIHLFDEPFFFTEDTFEPEDYLLSACINLFPEYLKGWDIPYDPATTKIALGEKLISMFEPTRFVAFYGYDLGPVVAPDAALKADFIARACQSGNVTEGGLYSDPRKVGVIRIMVRRDSSLPGGCEICEIRLFGWVVSAMSPEPWE